jgi:NAD(P)-dependent dehydrogenase (short-subunit alcohol dehydrogenase family)
MLLENKTAVIYGAGAIGGAVARAFAREGANVFLASRTRATVDVLADQIAAEGGAVEAAHVDASDERAVEDHLDRVNARTGGIDILFDAIGMDDIQGTLILEMPLEDLMQPVVKALRTQFLTARAAARHMVGRGSGAIMSITVAPTPVPYHGGFGVACSAIEGLWRSLAAELGPSGVRLVILRSAGSPDAPGVQETFERHAAAGGTTPEQFLGEASSGTLLRRLPTLAEVADAATIMASDRASAMTGAFANVTCGFWVDV